MYLYSVSEHQQWQTQQGDLKANTLEFCTVRPALAGYHYMALFASETNLRATAFQRLLDKSRHSFSFQLHFIIPIYGLIQSALHVSRFQTSLVGHSAKRNVLIIMTSTPLTCEIKYAERQKPLLSSIKIYYNHI